MTVSFRKTFLDRTLSASVQTELRLRQDATLKLVSVGLLLTYKHHTEVLESRDLEPQLRIVLLKALKVVNFLKAWPLNSRLFA